jgi:hypothetical protein
MADITRSRTVPFFGEHLAFEIIEFTDPNQFAQAAIGIGFSVAHAEEIGDGSADDLFSPVTEFL